MPLIGGVAPRPRGHARQRAPPRGAHPRRGAGARPEVGRAFGRRGGPAGTGDRRAEEAVAAEILRLAREELELAARRPRRGAGRPARLAAAALPGGGGRGPLPRHPHRRRRRRGAHAGRPGAAGGGPGRRRPAGARGGLRATGPPAPAPRHPTLVTRSAPPPPTRAASPSSTSRERETRLAWARGGGARRAAPPAPLGPGASGPATGWPSCSGPSRPSSTPSSAPGWPGRSRCRSTRRCGSAGWRSTWTRRRACCGSRAPARWSSSGGGRRAPRRGGGAAGPALALGARDAAGSSEGTATAAPATAPGALGLVQFSSGSTVDPKPVALTHAALQAQVDALIALVAPTAADVLVSRGCRSTTTWG